MQTQLTLDGDSTPGPDDLSRRERKLALGVFVALICVLLGVGAGLDRVTQDFGKAGASLTPRAVPFPKRVADGFARHHANGLGTAPTGQRWVSPSGKWSSGKGTARLVKPAPTGSSFALVRVGRGPGTIAVTAQAVSKGAGLAFRCKTALDCWTLTAVPELGTWKVTRITAAIPADLGNLGTTPVAPGTRLKLVNGPDGIDFYVNDVFARRIDDRELNDAPLAGLVANAELDVTDARFSEFEADQQNIVGPGAPIRDAFDRQGSSSLGRTPTGQRWKTQASSWGIRRGEAVLRSEPSLRASIATIDVGATEGWIQVTGSTIPTGFGAVFRYQDARNYWRIDAVPGYATWNVIKVIGGVETRVGSTGLTSYGNGSTVGIRLRGDEMTFFVDGFETVTMRSDELIDAHRAGMVVASNKGTGARFAGFAAGPLDLAGPPA